MPTAESITNSPTSTFENQAFWNTRPLVLDDINNPTVGGKSEPGLDLGHTLVIAGQVDRISALPEALEPQYQPVELAPDLITNTIPKWDSDLEMNRFFNEINKRVLDGVTLVEAVTESVRELEMNIRAYDSEIIKSKAVLPHINRFDYVDGALRMVGNNGEPVVNAISSQERAGSVLGASIAIEDSLLEAENNSFSVLMNPAGWNGYFGQNGQELSHLNAEPMVFWKDGKGQLKGLTFHVDLDLDQAEKVMSGLGAAEDFPNGKTDKDRIISLVRNPVLGLSLPESYANPFEYVLDKILAERGQRDFKLLQQGAKPEMRSVTSVKADIKRFETLLQGSQEEEALIAELKSFILMEATRIGEKFIQQQIVSRIEKTLLRLTRVFLKDSGQASMYQVRERAQVATIKQEVSSGISGEDFAAEIAYLKTRGGCPPGARGNVLSGISLGSSVEGVGGGGFVGTGLESDSMGSLYFPCPVCKTINKRPREGFVERCQNERCLDRDKVRC